MLPDLDARELREKLGTKRGFVWVKREITPRSSEEVYHLGLPGVGFLPENKRVYPNGHAAAHVLGSPTSTMSASPASRNIIDGQGLRRSTAPASHRPADLKPVQLSIDLRVQHALRDELEKGMEQVQGQGGGRASWT